MDNFFILPSINILIVVPWAIGELHDELDDVDCLNVHVRGVTLVSHQLSPAATHTEHNDGLQ